LAAILVRAFLRQAVVDGFFHADLHQGNLFALPDGRLAAVDFGIMGRIDGRRGCGWRDPLRPDHRQLPACGGDPFRRAVCARPPQYCRVRTALRAVGEPIRGLPVKDISVGQMLDGLFTITRDFDMPTQPHLLLLQKTMVMEEGVATWLDPDINMWETAEPFLREWLRTSSGPRRGSPTRSSATSARCAACPSSSAASITITRRPAPRPLPRRLLTSSWWSRAGTELSPHGAAIGSRRRCRYPAGKLTLLRYAHT
jgi:ubiquinone biosynthesis protein